MMRCFDWVPKKIDKCIYCKQNATLKTLLIEEDNHWGSSIYDYTQRYICHWCYNTMIAHFLIVMPLFYGGGNKKLIGKLYLTEENDRVLRKITVTDDGKLQCWYPNRKNANANVRELFILERQYLINNITYLNNYHNSVTIIMLLWVDNNYYLKCLPLEIINYIISYLRKYLDELIYNNNDVYDKKEFAISYFFE